MEATQGNNAELNKALAQVKSEMGKLKKESKNPFFKSSYADLNAHLEMVEPLLQANGLLLTQPVISNGQNNFVSTEITEISTGQTAVSRLGLPETKNMQDLGSAITYARRYTLGALLGIQAVDDDAEGAVGRGEPVGRATAGRKKASTDSLF